MKENFFKYFSEGVDDWGFKIITCGYNHTPAGRAYPQKGHPQSHNFTWEEGRKLDGFHLIYIPVGSGKLETENHTYEVTSGDAILIYEKEWHRYQPVKENGWEEYWVGFESNYLRTHVVPELFPDKESHLKKIGYQDDILIIFNHLLELASKKSMLFRKMLFGCLLQLLAHFSNPQKKKKHTNRNEHIVDETTHIIRQNVENDVNFKELAELFHISYSQFRKIFKEATGSPPNQYLINERIERAKRLLANTELPIKEIALKSGFNSIHYFSRIFKQKTGNRPSLKRKNYS